MTPSNDGWIRRYHGRRPDGPLLVCFPHAGGTATAYFGLSEALSSMAEVLVVQYPGRQDRLLEEPMEDLREMADRAAEALVPLLDRSPVLFGHSMGSVLAYEVALRLERGAGPRPGGLIASGRAAPSVPQNWGVHLMDDAGIVAKMTELAGTPKELLDDEELLATILPALRSDFRAIETYQDSSGARLGCAISAYCGDRDANVPREGFLAWKEHTAAEFRADLFEGDHFYLQALRPDVMRALARDLAAFGTGRLAGTR